MSEYVFAVMTRDEFSAELGGKLKKGDVVEMTKEQAVRYRRIGVAKPANRQQVDEWKAARNRDEAVDNLEEEEYITSDRVDVTDADVEADFERGIDDEDEDGNVNDEEETADGRRKTNEREQ